MGLVAASGRNPGGFGRHSDRRRDRRLRSQSPRQLIASTGSSRPIAQAQGYLAVGAGLIGLIVLLLPHPPEFNETGLLAIQVVSIGLGTAVFLRADRIPSWALGVGPPLATLNTTLAVYFSGDSTSGFALFYVWVALYVFYFPRSRAEGVFNVAWTVVNYTVAMVITPAASDASGADYSHSVIMVGTLVTAGTLLTYLRTRVERLMSRLTDAARTDPLTGLPNRAALREVLAREVERAKPEQRPLSLLVLDLDRLKLFNDRFGVSAADDVLERVGRLMEDHARLPDTVARSGGGEFAMVLPETDRHGAFLRAEEILGALRDHLRVPRGGVTASAGVASYPDHGTEVEEIMSAADEAMRAAKALGRDRVVLYSPEVTSALGQEASRRNVEAQAQMATVLSLAEALDQRDSGTARHSQTVGRLCEMMAAELGLSDDRVQRLRLAGVLHDIGKIAVSDSILRKPGPLNDEEWVQMRRHPELGARILSSREMDDVRGWVLAHHERPDGTGYPKGLTAEQIPLEASIVAVADAYEAMTSDRVYRPGMHPDAAREELLAGAGTQFSEQVVRALLRAIDREGVPAIG